MVSIKSYMKNKRTTLHTTRGKEGQTVPKHGHLKGSNSALNIVNGDSFYSCDKF